MKSFLSLILVLTSFSSFATDLCRKSVTSQLTTSKSAYTLLAEPGYILKPGADLPYRMGEVFNPTNEVAVVFPAAKSNGYYREYIGVVASLRTCKILTTIDIGDDLD